MAVVKYAQPNVRHTMRALSIILLTAVVVAIFFSGTNAAANHKNGKEIKTKIAVPAIAIHAEGPHYKHDENCLYYVDTFAPAIIRWDFNTETFTTIKLDGRSVGMIIPIKSAEHQFVVGADRRLALLEWDGRGNNTGILKQIATVDEDRELNQFNDGKADIEGNLWLGTLTRNRDNTVPDNGGNFYYFPGDETLGFNVKIRNTSISNGVAFGGDGTALFYIDSSTRKVFKYDLDLEQGEICNREVIFDLNWHPEIKGIPDGMTIDENDFIYVAIFGGGMVLKLDPGKNVGERLLQKIQIPATYVTSVTFGGPKLDVLYVTTSRLHLNEGEEPDAGSVFEVRNLATGRKENEASVNF